MTTQLLAASTESHPDCGRGRLRVSNSAAITGRATSIETPPHGGVIGALPDSLPDAYAAVVSLTLALTSGIRT